MKIEITVTQEELDEMLVDDSELEGYVVETLDDGGPNGFIDLVGYNVYVKVVDEKVV